MGLVRAATSALTYRIPYCYKALLHIKYCSEQKKIHLIKSYDRYVIWQLNRYFQPARRYVVIFKLSTVGLPQYKFRVSGRPGEGGQAPRSYYTLI